MIQKKIVIALIIGYFVFFFSNGSFKAEAKENLRPVTIDDLMKTRNVQEAQISPDGLWLSYVISEANLKENCYNSDIWMIPASGGKPFKLTNGPERDNFPRWSSDGRKMAFISNRDGKNQIWSIDPFGGEAIKLTNVKHGVGTIFWSSDSKRIAFLGPELESEEEGKRREVRSGVIEVDKDLRMIHIHILDVETKKVSQLTKGQFSVDSLSWSPDGEKIVFSARPSPKIPDLFNTDLYVVSTKDSKIHKIVKREGVDTSPTWSPDGTKIAFVSTDGIKEWIVNWNLCVVPAEGGIPRNISKDFDEFITRCQWSSDNKRIFFSSWQGVTRQLFSISPETGKIKRLTSGNRSYSNYSFPKDFDKIAFLATDPKTPTEVFISSLEKMKPLRLTWTNPHIQELSLGSMEIIHWKSKDGLKIEGLLIKPVGFVPDKKYPLLTYVHGGPAGRFEMSFSPQIGGSSPVQGESYPLQVFTNKGYAIFLPNPRGSNGYGEKFRKANIKDWGYGDYEDIMSGIGYLISQGIADPERLGIMGRSYGGYMTGWIITQTNRFKAASLGAGMSNLISFYGQTDIPGYIEYYMGEVPWRAMEEYERHSPIYFVANVKTPTLIIHGEKDPRVPLPQAWELYRALKKKNVPVEFIIYPRQGHMIQEPKFQLDEMNRNLEWFERWIK